MAKSISSISISDKTYRGFGNLIKLLPTGTVFIFQSLNPVLTNNGHCSPVNRVFTRILIGLCGFSCAFTCFTDSYKAIWPSSNSGSVNLSSYKLRIGDFVHIFFSLIVFAELSLLDTDTGRCFYPSFESTEKALLMAFPPVIGAISGVVFMAFPTTRQGIGHPSTSNDSSKYNSVDC